MSPILMAVIIFAAATVIVVAILFIVTNAFFNIGIPRSSNYLKNDGQPKEMSVWREAEQNGTPAPSEEDIAKMSERMRKNERLFGNERRETVKFICDRNPERFKIKSFDGLSLVAHYVKADDKPGFPKAIVIMVHGYRSHGLWDFSCAVPYFCHAGIACLIIDQRSHEESEGKYICYGTKEKYDVKMWAEFIADKFPGLPILLDGISMGAATVMLASGLDLPKDVKGIIADCGYTSPRDIFDSVIKKVYKVPLKFLMPVASLMIRRRAKFEISGPEADTKTALRKNRLPMLFAHGEADTFVPYSMGKANFETAKQFCDAEFLSVPNADHGLSFMIDRKGYIDAVNRLLVKCGIGAEIVE